MSSETRRISSEQWEGEAPAEPIAEGSAGASPSPRSAMSSADTYSPGLEGVLAGETAISTVTDGLSYRGYSVGELAEKCSFDEVAYLLLHGELPTKRQL